MSLSAVAGKNAPIIGPLIAAALAIDSDSLVTVGAVVIGLFFGALWRTASFLHEGKAWKEIRSDLLISVLIGGANAILTLALVDWLNLGLLFTMGLGVLIGATGLRALPEIRDAVALSLKRRLLGDNVVIVTPQDADMDAQVKALGAPPPAGGE